MLDDLSLPELAEKVGMTRHQTVAETLPDDSRPIGRAAGQSIGQPGSISPDLIDG